MDVLFTAILVVPLILGKSTFFPAPSFCTRPSIRTGQKGTNEKVHGAFQWEVRYFSSVPGSRVGSREDLEGRLKVMTCHIDNRVPERGDLLVRANLSFHHHNTE